MQILLLRSYTPLKRNSVLASDIRLKFKPIGYATGSDLKTDSIAGPKSVVLQVVPDDLVPKHKMGNQAAHSFSMREIDNTRSTLVPITKVNLQVSVSRPLGTGSADMEDESCMFSDPKLELTVFQSFDPVPELLITDETIPKGHLFCEDNLLWFKELMGGHLTLEVVYEDGRFAYRAGDSTSWNPFGPTCSSNLISALQRFLSKKVDPKLVPVKTLLPTAAEFQNFAQGHMAASLQMYDRACTFLKAAIPRLDAASQDPNSNQEWPLIQENLQVVSAFLQQFSRIRGLGGLIMQGLSNRNPDCIRYSKFEQLISNALEDECDSKNGSTRGEKVRKMRACTLLHRELPHDVVANISSILEILGPELPDFEACTTKDLAISTILQRILFASVSFELINRPKGLRVLSRSVPSGISLSVCNSQGDSRLSFATDFAYMLDGYTLQVWPRSRLGNRLVQLTGEQTVPVISGKYQDRLQLLGHSGNYLVFKQGFLDSRFAVLDAIQFVQRKDETVFICMTNYERGLLPNYCMDGTYFYSFVIREDSPGTIMQVTPINLGSSNPTLAVKCEVNFDFRVTVAFSTPKQPTRVFVASGNRLSCWSWSVDILTQSAQHQFNPISGQNPQSFSDRGDLQRIRCLNLEPTFFESRGKVYFARIVDLDFLELYGFSQNRFTVVTKGQRVLHRLPRGYFWLSDTSGSKTTLYAAKLVNADPKTFRIGKMLWC